MHEITVLGAYGTKAAGKGTSAFRLNHTHVIDAGNLICGMGEDVADIEGIWLTHSHLDHIIDIAFIMSSYFTERKKTLKIMGLPQTLEDLKNHFLNDTIWPDFSEIRMIDSELMSVEYVPVEIGKVYEIGESMTIEPIVADHIVPCCGYLVRQKDRAIVFSSDTYGLDGVIEKIESHTEVSAAVIECSFPSKMELLAMVSKHLTPKLLFEQLEKVSRKHIPLYINHVKPTYLDQISEEILRYKGEWNCSILDDGEKISF